MDIFSTLNTLELSPPVTFDDVKDQWRKLAKKYHPDKNLGSKEAEDKFKCLHTAFSYLEANQNLLSDLKPQSIQPSSGFIHTSLNVTLSDIYCHKEHTIYISRFIRCKSCSGTGSTLKEKGICPYCHGEGNIKNKVLSMLNGNTLCQYCNGIGILEGTKCKDCKGNKVHTENIGLKIKLDLKHHWYNGEILRGVGNEDINGKKGDVHVRVNIQSDSRFKIESDCFTTYIPITPVQKLIGDYGFIEVFGKNLKYEIMPQATEFIIYDKRPNFIFTRKVRVVFVEKPPEVITPEMLLLYKKILNLEKGRD